MARRLDPLEVHEVKRLLCEGWSQTDISRALDISQGTVNKIYLGDTHRDIPWPNKEVGEKFMRERGKRAERDKVQARLMSGVPQLPEPVRDIREARQVREMNEDEAVEQARKAAELRRVRFREIERRIEEDDKEQDRLFKEKMKGDGVIDQTEVKPQVSFWSLPFLEWEKVVGRAKDIDVVDLIADKVDDLNDYDKIVQRAIGIVFLQEEQEDWEDEQVLKKIASVVEQLKVEEKNAS